MRKIKFRVWSEKWEQWLNQEEHVIYADNGDVGEVNDCELVEFIVHDTLVEQFTGLHDKNGRQIYEGDIVEITVNNNIYAPSKGAAKFVPVKEIHSVEVRPGITTVGKWILCEFKQDKIQVIGNIHENKELLDEKV